MTKPIKRDPKAAEGVKKVQLHLVPPVAIQAEARAFEVGAAKYGAYNWRRSDEVLASTYVSAALRHLQAFQDGEDMVGDMPGVHHLGAVRASMAVLLDAMAAGTFKDDRPKPLKKAAYACGTVTMKNEFPLPLGVLSIRPLKIKTPLNPGKKKISRTKPATLRVF